MIRLIIGLGNPGHSYYYQRHSIGFRVLDALVAPCGASWRAKDKMEIAEVDFNGERVYLVKPQTYMNSSGDVLGYFKKQGILPAEILVVHDELELPFGKLAFKTGGSAKGHNGLKSIIAALGTDSFERLRFGIGRPPEREQVPAYVLQNFSEPPAEVERLITEAVQMLKEHI
jgi:PTH1 family peptidyl-tRNA hydrolase